MKRLSRFQRTNDGRLQVDGGTSDDEIPDDKSYSAQVASSAAGYLGNGDPALHGGTHGDMNGDLNR